VANTALARGVMAPHLRVILASLRMDDVEWTDLATLNAACAFFGRIGGRAAAIRHRELGLGGGAGNMWRIWRMA